MQNNHWLPGDKKPLAALQEMIRVNHAGEYGATVIYKGQIAWLNFKSKIEKYLDKSESTSNISENINKNLLSELNKMLHQEQEHFSYFNKKILQKNYLKIKNLQKNVQDNDLQIKADAVTKEHSELILSEIRPSALQPLWHYGGFALGFFSAMLGLKASMACTVAVENVIENHYREQILHLDDYIFHNLSILSVKNDLFWSQKELQELQSTILKFRLEEIQHGNIGIEQGAENMMFYNIFHCFIYCITRLSVATAKKI